MSEVRFTNEATPIPPPDGNTRLFIDIVDGHAKTIDSNGTIFDLTEAFPGVFPNQQTVVNSLAALPIPSGGEFALPGDTLYVLGDDVDLGTDRLNCDAGNIAWTGGSLFGPRLTYTGSLSMFRGTDAPFDIRNIQLDCPNSRVFEFDDVAAPGSSINVIDTIQVLRCQEFGRYTNLLSIVMENSNALDCQQGIELLGSSWLIQSFIKFALFSGNPSFVGLGFGAAVSPNVEISNLFFSAPIGGVGVSGLTNSGNIAVDGVGTFRDSNFIGGLIGSELAGLVPDDDVRWRFNNNSGIQDTMPRAMTFLRDNATPTVIADTAVPVAILGTFAEAEAAHYTTDAAGLITYIGEVARDVDFDIAAVINPASGANKDVTVYLALNGTFINNSGKGVNISSGDPKEIGVVWALRIEPNDTFQIFVQNSSDLVSLVGIDVVLRVR